MADVRVKHKETGEIVEMSEYAFSLERDFYSLVGEEAKVNQRPVIEEKKEEPATLGGVPSLLEQPKPKVKVKGKK